MEEVWCLRWILDAFCAFAGQRINKGKSELFVSPNMKVVHRVFLTHVFGVKIVDRPGVYLGADLDFTKRKGALFQRILDRVRHRLANWRMGSLPFPGRLVLAKHTLKAVPIYLFSAFRALKYLIKQVKKVVAGFLWGKGEGRGIHRKRWDDLCKPLGHGGLGLRDLRASIRHF